MKANLKKMLGLAALGMALLGNTAPTWAGSAGAPEVSITRAPTYAYARGSMVGARYSADSRQYIGCSINAHPFVVCSAQDSAGNFLGCVSYDAAHIASVQRMTDSSLIHFDMNPGNNACTVIRLYNSSSFLR